MDKQLKTYFYNKTRFILFFSKQKDIYFDKENSVIHSKENSDYQLNVHLASKSIYYLFTFCFFVPILISFCIFFTLDMLFVLPILTMVYLYDNGYFLSFKIVLAITAIFYIIICIVILISPIEILNVLQTLYFYSLPLVIYWLYLGRTFNIDQNNNTLRVNLVISYILILIGFISMYLAKYYISINILFLSIIYNFALNRILKWKDILIYEVGDRQGYYIWKFKKR